MACKPKEMTICLKCKAYVPLKSKCAKCKAPIILNTGGPRCQQCGSLNVKPGKEICPPCGREFAGRVKGRAMWRQKDIQGDFNFGGDAAPESVDCSGSWSAEEGEG